MYLLGLDPSFTATGWVVVDLKTLKVVATGVIRTAKAKATERLSAAEDAALRGSVIRRGVTRVLRRWEPVAAAQEGDAGSQHALAAKGLARAQQACVDAVDAALGALPIFVTPTRVKKVATGKNSASKKQIEDVMLAYWGDEIVGLLKKSSVSRAKTMWENAFDALAVVYSVLDHPSVVIAKSLG